MKKKLLALLMTMIMCISLSACGASSSQTGEVQQMLMIQMGRSSIRY